MSGYTYVDHVSWDAYNESSDLGMQLELYNIMKFLRGLLCLIFEKSGLKTFQKRIMRIFDSMEAVLPTPQGCVKEIN